MINFRPRRNTPNKMYHTIYLDERVSLTPGELNGIQTTDHIRDMIITKLKEKHEGKCNSNGYVRPGSLQVLARSMGTAQNGKFTGDFVYDCKTKCDVLFPTADSILEATVIKINKMGAYAIFEEAIRILLPRDLHIGNTTFDNIQENDALRIRIKRTRFDTNSPFIMAVGVLENQPDLIDDGDEVNNTSDTEVNEANTMVAE